ncbi:MAG: 3-oxoacyl-(acyl-carrier-protein) reductase [Verrucomicrobiales bacterium]|nr:3-oxoacyl-(acyl-carrier-protein) reductase [Verrucomicrobiales bacterium]
MTNVQPGKIAVVTGSSGGLGSALVEAMAEAGYVVWAGFHKNRMDFPGLKTVIPFELDITNPVAVAEMFAKIELAAGNVHVLVNNAGIAQDDFCWKMGNEDFDHVMSVNLDGAMHCSREALKIMEKGYDGQIINVGSYAGIHGAIGQANYAASKAGLAGFTTALAREAGPLGVRVNMILPGLLPSRMTASLHAETLEALVQQNVLKRMNTLSEVAGFVVHLARMNNVSGQIFSLDSRISSWA